MKNQVKDSRLEVSEQVKCKTEQRLRRAGITRTRLYTKLSTLLDAKKTVSCVSGKDAAAGSVDFVDVDDCRVQLDTAKLLIDIYGDKAALKVDAKHEGRIEVLITNFAGASDPPANPEPDTRTPKGGRRK